MQDLCKKDSRLSSAPSVSPDIVSCPSWWSSTDSHVQQSSVSNTLSLKMETPSNHLSFKLQEQDSLSTQSTGQSYPELASLGGSNGNSIVSVQSGSSETHGKPLEGLITSVSSMGSQDSVFCHSVYDYGGSIAHMSLHYAEPYFGGLLSAANVPQAMRITPTRMPLPLDYPLGEPIYVNAKQYHAILRRRQCRSKLDAQNKALKNRKPYIHESRHLHAIKRARGSGGRFLNTKKLQESKTTPTTDGLKVPASFQLHRTGNISGSEVYQPENYGDNGSTTSCSDVTSASNSDDIFQQPEYKLSRYRSHIGGTIQGGRNQHQFSVLLR